MARVPHPATPDQADTEEGRPLPTSTSATPDTAGRSGAAGAAGATSGPDLAVAGAAPRSLEGLEAEICDLASRIAIATHEWLRLIVAFDRREGWRTSGCRSTAQWMSWRCGMSLSAAYEHLRVGRALEDLPKVAAEFAAGRLSYSKVRALTRIADTDQRSSRSARNPSQETKPVPNGDPAESQNHVGEGDRAGHPATCGREDAQPVDAQPEGAEAGDAEAEDAEPREAEPRDAEDELLNLARSATASQLDRIARGCAAARSKEQNLRRAMRRGIWWFTDDDGSLVIRGRLAPDEGATVVAALEAALDTLLARKSEPCQSPEPPASTEPASPPEPTPSSAVRPVGDPSDSTGFAGSGDGTDPAGPRMHPAPDGTSPDSSAEDSGPARTSPEGTPPSDPQAASRAVPYGHRGALSADALVMMAETLLSNTPAFLNSADKYRVIVHLTPLAEPGMFTASPQFPSPRSAHLDDGTPLPPDTASRLACEATVTNVHLSDDGQIRGLSDPTRFPRAATARAVRIRARHTCQAPGCTTRHGLQIHHVRHWSHGGETSLANLVLICRYHHWLVHEGRHTFAARPGGTFGFYRPDGAEIPATPSLPGVADRDRTRSVLDRWGDVRRALGEDVLTPPWWSGDPLDLHYAVSVILDAQTTLN